MSPVRVLPVELFLDGFAVRRVLGPDVSRIKATVFVVPIFQVGTNPPVFVVLSRGKPIASRNEDANPLTAGSNGFGNFGSSRRFRFGSRGLSRAMSARAAGSDYADSPRSNRSSS